LDCPRLSFVQRGQQQHLIKDEDVTDLDWALAGLPQPLGDDLRRVTAELGPEDSSSYALSSLQVLRCHYLVADYFTQLGHGLLQPGVKSAHLLQSAVSRQHVGFGSTKKWNDVFTVAGTLLYGLIKNHPFHDANKRTAILACLYQLQHQNRVPNVEQKQYEDLAECVAADALSNYARYKKVTKNDDAEVLFIADFLRAKTRKVDKREYRVSYRQLDALLRRHGYTLDDPHDNKIYLYKVIKRPRTLFRSERIERVPIAQLGFRDWGTEVSWKDLKYVRSQAQLTDKEGIDSRAFFQGLDPIESLIAQYSDLLKRLSRK
jgi:death-on-curing protein